MLGFTNRASATRALDNALRLGISQFDVARTYGYGQAERLLGDFFASNRSTVKITSKYGIASATGLRANAIRLLRGGTAGLRHLQFFGNANAQSAHSVFWSASAIQKSLEQSLGELRTEYLDEFLLHSPPPELALRDEVFQALASAQRAGKVRQVGVSSDAQTALAFLPKLQTAQISFNLEHPALPMQLRAFPKTINHVYGGRGGSARMGLRIKHALAEALPQFDPSFVEDPAQLNEAILRVSLAAAGARAAVVSMNNPSHQALNVAAVVSPVLPDLLIQYLSEALFSAAQNK